MLLFGGYKPQRIHKGGKLMLFSLTGMLTSSEYMPLNGVNVINVSNAILINQKRISVYQALSPRRVPGYVYLCPTSSGSQQPLYDHYVSPDPRSFWSDKEGSREKNKTKKNIVQKWFDNWNAINSVNAEKNVTSANQHLSSTNGKFIQHVQWHKRNCIIPMPLEWLTSHLCVRLW